MCVLPQKLTAVWIVCIIKGELEDAAQVQRQPTQSKDQHQAEHGLGHFTSLQEITAQGIVLYVK